MPTHTTPKRTKTGGGSRKGKPNRAKAAFREELQAYCDGKGFDPFHAMVNLAMDRTLEDQHLRFAALKELCQYLQPKLRSVELTGDDSRPLQVHHFMTTLRDALDRAYGARQQPRTGPGHPLVAVGASANGR